MTTGNTELTALSCTLYNVWPIPVLPGCSYKSFAIGQAGSEQRPPSRPRTRHAGTHVTTNHAAGWQAKPPHFSEILRCTKRKVTDSNGLLVGHQWILLEWKYDGERAGWVMQRLIRGRYEICTGFWLETIGTDLVLDVSIQ